MKGGGAHTNEKPVGVITWPRAHGPLRNLKGGRGGGWQMVRRVNPERGRQIYRGGGKKAAHLCVHPLFSSTDIHELHVYLSEYGRFWIQGPWASNNGHRFGWLLTKNWQIWFILQLGSPLHLIPQIDFWVLDLLVEFSQEMDSLSLSSLQGMNRKELL